jgi:thioredoxin reductase (NADPH)
VYSETALDPVRLVPKHLEQFDLIIIGAGPAGSSAAICAARAKLKILVLERAFVGGQAGMSYHVENLLGFQEGVMGENLARIIEKQVLSQDCYLAFATVEQIVADNLQPTKAVHTNLGHIYYTKAVILANGLEPKKLEKSFETSFLGRGISYYAQGDAAFYANKSVAVIGGGNCACYAADYLSGFVDHLYLIHNSNTVKAVKTLKEKILNNPKIQCVWDSTLDDVFGIDKVEKIKVVNGMTGQHTWLDVKGVFLYVGRIPPKDFALPGLRTDEKGFVITDECMRSNIQGVYAVGDIRSKQIRQIATAISDGMIAAVNVERDLARKGNESWA